MADGPSALACTSVAMCVLGDQLGRIVLFDGLNWSSPRLIDRFAGIASVSCPTSTYCVALDNLGYALTFNGKTWTQPVRVEP